MMFDLFVVCFVCVVCWFLFVDRSLSFVASCSLSAGRSLLIDVCCLCNSCRFCVFSVSRCSMCVVRGLLFVFPVYCLVFVVARNCSL